jgi:hypothetical protein
MISLRCAVAAAVLAAAPFARAVPEWVAAAARTPVPQYPANTRAVMLLDATKISVDGDTIVTHRRRVIRILTAAGRDQAELDLVMDRAAQLRDLHAWSITNGVEKAVSERDAIETALFGDVYDDLRVKVLRIPGTQAGSLIAYEYEESERPEAKEATWHFQGDLPVIETQLSLGLTVDLFDAHWFSHEPVAPSIVPNGVTWTLRDVPAIDDEPHRPASEAIAGRLSLSFGTNAHRSWSDVASWYARLAEARCTPTPQLETKVRAMVANGAPVLDRIRALGGFVQQQVRYVAVEIGIGGYQPHRAEDVFSNRYGDCKDKVTLLRSMLRAASVDSYYVLVNATPGVVDPEFATASVFNHVIIAIRLPPGTSFDGLHATVQHARLGTLLFFDPTNDVTPVGELPLYLQQSRGLLVTGGGGELITLPVAPPSANQLRRHAVLQLDEKGKLTGEVEEVRSGTVAAALRALLRPLNANARISAIESVAASRIPGLSAGNVRIENLDVADADLVIRYSVVVPTYTTRTAGLILVRPPALGGSEETIVDAQHRKYSYVTDGPRLHSDEIEIALPGSFQLDELPPPGSVSNDFVSYSSSALSAGGKLVFRRQYQMKAFSVPAPALAQLNGSLSKIDADERSSAVFLEKP